MCYDVNTRSLIEPLESCQLIFILINNIVLEILRNLMDNRTKCLSFYFVHKFTNLKDNTKYSSLVRV